MKTKFECIIGYMTLSYNFTLRNINCSLYFKITTFLSEYYIKINT